MPLENQDEKVKFLRGFETLSEGGLHDPASQRFSVFRRFRRRIEKRKVAE
jgi:hypothetical protein